VTRCRAAPLHRQHHAARVGKAQAASHEGLVICSRSNDRGEPGGLDRPVRVSGSRAHACLRPLQAGGARQAAPREPAAHQQQKSPHGGHSWVPHCSFLSNGCRIARGGRKSVRDEPSNFPNPRFLSGVTPAHLLCPSSAAHRLQVQLQSFQRPDNCAKAPEVAHAIAPPAGDHPQPSCSQQFHGH
jgi:hypothetical protein